MVWFTFAFLLGIPNDDEENSEDDPKKKQEKSQVEMGYTEIEVSKPNFTCHIEYILVPREAPKFIDVVCWDRAAKIYFQDSTCAIIPLRVEKLKWIHFRVNHKIELKLEEVPLFHSHIVKFTVKLGSKSFGEPAKSDKPKKFYGPDFSETSADNTIQKQMFQPLSESLDDLLSVSYFKGHLTPQQQLYISLDTTLETSEHYNKLFKALMSLTDEYHDKDAVRKPTPPFEEIPPLLDIQQQPKRAEETGEPKKGKRDGKEKEKNKTEKRAVASVGKNKEPSAEMEFAISGEQFLSGQKIFENCVKYNSEELPYVFCLGTVKNALSEAQASSYNPLSVVISTLDYVPVDELKKSGITKLKFRFLICNQFLAESNFIPVEKRMEINLARTIFTHGIDTQELIHFIQTTGINVEVLGDRDESVLGLEGEGDRTKDIKTGDKEEKFVVLGRVSADISSILLQPHRVSLICNFQPPNGNGISALHETEITTINEFNSCLKVQRKYEKVSPFCSGNFSPVLQLKVGLGHPLTKIWRTVTINPDLFNRLFVVFYDVDLAIPIIQMIQGEMDEILGLSDYTRNGINARRLLTKNNGVDLASAEGPRKNQKMTGFLIDCVDKILMYAESSVFGGVQKVWASTSYLSPAQGRVLYDSSLIFLERLYKNLFQFGGFIGITLKEPLQVILSKPQCYSSESIPKPAQKALRCLSLLTDCKSIKTATKNNLFPDFDSLASLAIEFGTPIQISDKR